MKRSKHEAQRLRISVVVAGLAVAGAVANVGVLLASDDDARQPQSGLYDDRGLGEDHGPGSDAGPGEDHGPGDDYGPGEEHGPGNDYGPGEEHGPGEDYGPTSIGGTGASGVTPGPTPRMPSSGISGGSGSAGGGSR